MKKIWKVLLSIVAAIIIIVCGITAYSHLKYDRSVGSTIAEWYLSAIKKEYTVKSAEAYLKDIKNKGEKNYKIDKSMKFDVPIKKANFNGMDTYVLNPEKNNGTVLLDIHGGAYISQPTIEHWMVFNEIAKETNAKVIVPIYPLAPFATYEKSYSLLTDLYKDLAADTNTKKIVMAGDSAGGGLALGLAESFKENNIAQPDALILISPWVDITMTNPEIKKFEDQDPMLDKNSLIVDGKSWAGNLDTTDYKVSPIYGDLSGLKNVTIFVGTREMFYPDIMDLYKKLKKEGIEAKLHVGQGQNHDYPYIPVSVEGKEAVKEIIKNINDL